jgi:hypothetical protein
MEKLTEFFNPPVASGIGWTLIQCHLADCYFSTAYVGVKLLTDHLRLVIGLASDCYSSNTDFNQYILSFILR